MRIFQIFLCLIFSFSAYGNDFKAILHETDSETINEVVRFAFTDPADVVQTDVDAIVSYRVRDGEFKVVVPAGSTLLDLAELINRSGANVRATAYHTGDRSEFPGRLIIVDNLQDRYRSESRNLDFSLLPHQLDERLVEK